MGIDYRIVGSGRRILRQHPTMGQSSYWFSKRLMYGGKGPVEMEISVDSSIRKGGATRYLRTELKQPLFKHSGAVPTEHNDWINVRTERIGCKSWRVVAEQRHSSLRPGLDDKFHKSAGHRTESLAVHLMLETHLTFFPDRQRLAMAVAEAVHDVAKVHCISRNEKGNDGLGRVWGLAKSTLLKFVE